MFSLLSWLPALSSFSPISWLSSFFQQGNHYKIELAIYIINFMFQLASGIACVYLYKYFCEQEQKIAKVASLEHRLKLCQEQLQYAAEAVSLFHEAEEQVIRGMLVDAGLDEGVVDEVVRRFIQQAASAMGFDETREEDGVGSEGES